MTSTAENLVPETEYTRNRPVPMANSTVCWTMKGISRTLRDYRGKEDIKTFRFIMTLRFFKTFVYS